MRGAPDAICRAHRQRQQHARARELWRQQQRGLESHVLAFFAGECAGVPNDEVVIRVSPSRARALARASGLGSSLGISIPGSDNFDVRVRDPGRDQHLSHGLRIRDHCIATCGCISSDGSADAGA